MTVTLNNYLFSTNTNPPPQITAQAAERAQPDFESESDDDNARGLGQRGNAEAPPDFTVAAAAAVAFPRSRCKERSH